MRPNNNAGQANDNVQLEIAFCEHGRCAAVTPRANHVRPGVRNILIKTSCLRWWCEAFSSRADHQGAWGDESRGPTPKGGKVDLFDTIRLKKRIKLKSYTSALYLSMVASV